MTDISSPEKSSVLLRLHSPLPPSLEVGDGQFLVVSGDCVVPETRVKSVHVIVDNDAFDSELSPIRQGVSFWQAVFLSRETTGRSIRLSISVKLDDDTSTVLDAGEVKCRSVSWKPIHVRNTGSSQNLVAICMATYNPDLDAFKCQIDSIRKQTHDPWVCIINDDGSDEHRWKTMRDYCAKDDRFHCFRNGENQGFYRNFETVLKRVPLSAAYVAFSDQDDFWYPEKLRRLVERLDSGDATLAYSDMRIVDENGKEIAASYWVNRKNEYHDPAVVLVANTVTGAASLFRTEILKYLIPFPPKVGDAFHDHWLACVAMANGRLAYIDEALYSYYQYGESVIGHCDFVRFTILQRIVSMIKFVCRLFVPRIAVPMLKHKYAAALAIYRGECRRLRLIGQTIRYRCPARIGMSRHLYLFDGGIKSVAMLLIFHLKVLMKGQTTDDAELRLAMGEFARIIERERLEKIK